MSFYRACEANLIRGVDPKTYSKLKDKSLNDTEEDLVGVGSRVEELMSILAIGSNRLGGIGKTTIVRAVYNRIFNHFETCSFVENVGEESKARGLKTLQKKKVLLILDDVGKHCRFKTLVGNWDWFGHGSRVILTTEDKHLRKYLINYAQGIPLALEVWGSDLYTRTNEEWEGAGNQLRATPHDGLEEVKKILFLDIAYFFEREEKNRVADILESLDLGDHIIVSGELWALQPIFQIYGRRQVFEDNVLVREFLDEKGNGRVLIVDVGGKFAVCNIGGQSCCTSSE